MITSRYFVSKPKGVKDPNWSPYFKNMESALRVKHPDITEQEIHEICYECAREIRIEHGEYY